MAFRRIPPLLALSVLLLAFVLGDRPAAQRYQPTLFDELRWRSIGPHRGGRTKAAAGIPDEPNVFYVGVVNGGVWKTTDYGRVWTPIFDDQPTGSIGAIAVAPSAPDVIYVGSGEGLQRPDLSTGDGIFKSTDAGRSWTHLGLRDAQQIPQIIVDPRNPDRLFVAVLGHPYGPNEERGIFRSTDGARTFRKVLYKDENTGGVDVAFDPSNPDTIYAALWEARQGPWENAEFSGPGSGVFKSTDGGDTWSPINTGLPTFERDGLGRIGIIVAPSAPSRLFATVDARSDGGLYRSDDAGASWYRVNADSRFTSRGSDFAEVKVHPTNPDVVFTGSIVAWKSTDGGKSFSAFRGAPGGDDYHRIWINPKNPDIILLASDQGAVVTVNGGRTFSSWYNQPTAQFYHVTADNAFPYRLCGGQQESGSACVQSRGDDGRITFREWHPVGVEEYGYVAPDPLDPDIVYGGKVTRYDRRTGQVQNVAPKPLRDGGYRVIRTMPILFSPIDPRTLYFGSNTLWKTTNGGRNWTGISPDLTRASWDVPANVGKYRGTEAARPSQRGVIYTIAPSYVDANTIWVGTDDGLIHVTRDGGKTWKDVTPPALTPWAKVSLMDAGHRDARTAYAAINTFRLDDLRPHIYRTHDGGATWTRITSGIPDAGIVNVVREDPKAPGLLFAGTEREVYVSFDDGEHWQSLRTNMPATSIRDLIVKDDDLAVGTHGRGFWILDDITPLREMAASARAAGSSARRAALNVRVASAPMPSAGADLARPAGRGPAAQTIGRDLSPGAARGAAFDPAAAVHLFTPQTATRFRWNKNTDTPLPPDEPAGQNPPDGAILHYYLQSAAGGAVTLEILDPAGAIIRTYSSDEEPEPIRDEGMVPAYWMRPTQILSSSAGLHRFVWDLHYERPRALSFTFPIAATPGDTARVPHGPWAPPGRYTVKLTAGGTSYTRPLVVRMDPRVKTPAADLTQQFTLSMRLYTGIGQAYEAIQAARARQSGDVPDATVRELTQLHQQLLTLYTVVQGADAAPTTQTVAAAEQSLKRIVAFR
jgi:photosystem II stability/assembly factor-like uncharacterized protein